ncbi:MAG: penicillin-binding protein activator LpoB [bacterium]
MRSLALASPLLALALALPGCGPAYVRGSENPELDEYAMSTGLDKKDLEKLFDENADSLMKSGAVRRWKDMAREGKDAKIAIFRVKNETSEHIDSQLQALLSKFETRLVNSGDVTVISREQQDTLIEELRKQQGAAFDPNNSAQLGRQLGAQYFLTGKVYDSAEKTGDERRTQYFLFMQVIEVETGVVRWQNEANLTKGLVN